MKYILDQSKWVQGKEIDNRGAATLLLVNGKYYRWVDGKWTETECAQPTGTKKQLDEFGHDGWLLPIIYQIE